MKKLLIPLLILFCFTVKAQTSITPQWAVGTNPDSLRFTYSGNTHGFQWIYNAATVRALIAGGSSSSFLFDPNFRIAGDSVHLAPIVSIDSNLNIRASKAPWYDNTVLTMRADVGLASSNTFKSIDVFNNLYAVGPDLATDWRYKHSGRANVISLSDGALSYKFAPFGAAGTHAILFEPFRVDTSQTTISYKSGSDSTAVSIDASGIHISDSTKTYNISNKNDGLYIGDSGGGLKVYSSDAGPGDVCIGCTPMQGDFGYTLTLPNTGPSGILLAGGFNIDNAGQSHTQNVTSGDSSDNVANTAFVMRAAHSGIGNTIYTGDGSLTGDRNVDQTGHSLTFTIDSLSSFNISGIQGKYNYNETHEFDFFQLFQSDTFSSNFSAITSSGTGITFETSKSSGLEQSMIDIEIDSAITIQDDYRGLGMKSFKDYSANIIKNDSAYTTTKAVRLLIDSLGGGGSTTHPLTFGYGFTSISPFDGSSAETAKIDTSLLQTVLNFFPKGDTRYYKASNPSGYISAAVTSITPGVGFLSHAPITNTGTMNVDTASTIGSKLWAFAAFPTKAFAASTYQPIGTYLTANQSISFAPTGDVTGPTTGTTSLTPALSIGTGKVTNAMLAGSIAAAKLIGSDIATVGTVTTGTWNASPITNQYLTNSGNNDFLVLNELGSAAKGYVPGQAIYATNASLALTNGTIVWTAVYVPKTSTLTGVKIFMNTVGSYTTTGYNGIGLYSINASTGLLTLVASSTTSGTLWQSTFGLTVVPFSSTYSAVEGVYYVAMLYQRSAEVTAPKIYVVGTTATVPAMDFPNGIKLEGTLASQTTLPTTQASSGITVIGNAAYLFLY